MTAQPRNIADPPPGTAGQGADVLTEVLRAVRLNGSVFMSGVFATPFGVISPTRWSDTEAMAHLRHASVFHLITEGGCWLQTAEGTRCELSAGDVVLMPFTAEHRFWSGDPNGFVHAETLVRPGPIEGVDTIRYGEGGEHTRIVCGFLESAEMLAAPLFRSLPHLLVERTDDALTGMLASTVGEILRQLDAAQPGAQLLLGRLMELLFVEVLRRHAARLPTGATGLLAALNDPVVGRALKAIHADPAHRWTVEALAKEAGASRTVLAERCNAVLGKPPIEYVAGWRLQLAAEHLRESNDSLALVAERAGYESEAAFSRAFKRAMGVSPGRWRSAG